MGPACFCRAALDGTVRAPVHRALAQINGVYCHHRGEMGEEVGAKEQLEEKEGRLALGLVFGD